MSDLERLAQAWQDGWDARDEGCPGGYVLRPEDDQNPYQRRGGGHPPETWGFTVRWTRGEGPYLVATCDCGWTATRLRTVLLAEDWDAHDCTRKPTPLLVTEGTREATR